MRKAFREFVRRDRKQASASPSALGLPTLATANAEEPPVAQTTSLAGTPSEDDAPTNDGVAKSLWAIAYKTLLDKEPNLVADYERHIGARPEERGDTARASAVLSPESVKGTVQALQADRENKQWKVSIRGKDHKVRDQLESLVKLLTLADSVIKQALSVQPYAALAWSAVSVFLPLLSSTYAKDVAMVKGFAAIADLQIYWKLCEDVYLQSTTSRYYQILSEPLSSLYSSILEYQVQAICHLSKKQLSRAWRKMAGGDDWAVKEKNILEIHNRCISLIDPLHAQEIRENWTVQNRNLQHIGKIEQEILGTIQDQDRRNKERSLLEALKSAAGNYLGGKDYNPSPVQGTCRWFFEAEEFSTWRDDSSSGVFWVTAGPGCGKSVLARALITDDHLKSTVAMATLAPSTTSTKITSSEVAICYFFFKDDVLARTKITTALCALLHQLFVQAPEFLEQGVSAFSQNGAALVKSFDDLWHLLLLCAQNATSDVICVLDALDECSGDDRRTFVSQLHRLYAGRPAAASHLKFLITSRPYDTIEESFRPLQDQTQYFRFDADERHADISYDISLVIDANIDSFARDFDEADRQKIAKSLKSGGTKTYLWLYLTLDIIRQHPSRFRRFREVETLLAELPTKVSEAYEKILNSSAEDEFSNSEQEKVKSLILQIILAATRPLTLDEANYALTMALADDSLTTHAELTEDRWKRDFKATVKNLCGLVISVYDGHLFFIHLTAREFLLREPEPGITGVNWRGRFSNPNALHEVLLRCCMRYLLLSELSSSPIPLPSEDVAQYPLLQYASVNWTHHFRAQKYFNAYSMQQARQLCSTSNNALRIWGPIYLASSTRELGFTHHEERFFGWTDLTVASFFGLNAIIENILATDQLDIDAVGGAFGSPLQSAVIAQRRSTAALLLANNANVSATNSTEADTPLKLAALKVANKEMTELLLSHGAYPYPPLKKSVRSSRVRSSRCGHRSESSTLLRDAARRGNPEIFYTLVAEIIDIGSPDAIFTALEAETVTSSGYVPDDIITALEAHTSLGYAGQALLANLLDDEMFESPALFTQKRLRALMKVAQVGTRALKVIAQKKLQHLLIDRFILESAYHYQETNKLLHTFFDETAAPYSDITQGILEVVAEHYSPDIFKRFLEYCPAEARDIGKLLAAAARNQRNYATSLPDWLLDGCEDPAAIDEATLSSLISYGPILPAASIFIRFPQLLPRHAARLISAVIHTSSARRGSEESPSNREVISRILSLCPAEAAIDDALLVETALRGDTETLELFLTYFVDKALPIQQLYEACTHNWAFGRKSMELLLGRYGLSSVNVFKIISLALRHRGKNGCLNLLLQKSSNQEPMITAELVAYVSSREVLDVLSKHLGTRLPALAPEALLIASDQDPHADHMVMPILLFYCEGALIHPTEELVVNLLTGILPWETITTLIHKVGDRIVVTERILRAAAGCGIEMLEMLERWRPRSFRITQSMAQEAAISRNKGTLEYLAERGGEAFVIDSKLYRLVDLYDKMHHVRHSADYNWQDMQDIPDLEDVRGRTTLHRALIRYMRSEFQERRILVRCIIQFITIDINAKTKNSGGWTPLQYAVAGYDLQIVQILLDAGAEATLANGRGQTAISLIENDFETGMDREELLAVLKGEKRVTIDSVVTKDD
ncbi:hypothetical protein PWT90_05383 [Aphanocladium album]|nr:hypothetical protein PWT90_05383 [Aphanocladium album]